MDIFIAVLVVIAIVAGFYFMIYNGLIHAQTKVQEAWSGISVQLKRRYDLIPSLVDTVKGYAKHEAETLSKVIEARSKAMANNGKPSEQVQDENILSGTLKSLFALSENYPDLKANQNFMQLQQELSNTEDQIASIRRIYNANVTAYNVKIKTVPNNIVAGIHHFEPADFFEMNEAEAAAAQKAPEIKF